jgi:ribosomal protein L17
MSEESTQQAVAEEVDSPEVAQANSEFELSEREMAIARGEDPDMIEASEAAPEEPAAEENTDPEPEPEKPETDQSPDWAGDDAREISEAYGLDISDFDSEASFNAAANAFSKKFAEVGDEELTKETPEETSEESSSSEEDSPEDLTGKFNERVETLREAGYEDDVLDLLRDQHEAVMTEKQHSEELRSQMEHLVERQQQDDLDRQAADFHSLADTLDESLFGQTFEDGKFTNISKEHDANREKLWNAMDVIANGMVQQAVREGKEPHLPSDKALAELALNMEFGTDLRGRAAKDVSRKVQQQSNRRRPVGSAKASAPSATQQTKERSVEDIASDPRFEEFFKN